MTRSAHFEQTAPFRALLSLARAKLSLACLRSLTWIALGCWCALWWSASWYASTLFSPGAIDFIIAISRDLRLEHTGSQTLNAFAAAALLASATISFTAIIAGIVARKAAAEEIAATRHEAIRVAGHVFHTANERAELYSSTPASAANRPSKRL